MTSVGRRSVSGSSLVALPALVRRDLALDVHAQVVRPADALLFAGSAVCLPGLLVETEDTVGHGVAGCHGKRLAPAYAIRRPDARIDLQQTHMHCLCVSRSTLVAFCICDCSLRGSRDRATRLPAGLAPMTTSTNKGDQ